MTTESKPILHSIVEAKLDEATVFNVYAHGETLGPLEIACIHFGDDEFKVLVPPSSSVAETVERFMSALAEGLGGTMHKGAPGSH